MTAIALAPVINHINGLHLFWDTLHIHITKYPWFVLGAKNMSPASLAEFLLLYKDKTSPESYHLNEIHLHSNECEIKSLLQLFPDLSINQKSNNLYTIKSFQVNISVHCQN